MSSTIDTSDVQDALSTFEDLTGLSFEEFGKLGEDEQEQVLYAVAAAGKDDEFSECIEELESFSNAMVYAWNDMIENGTALEQAVASQDMQTFENSEWALVLMDESETDSELSSMWGEQSNKYENNNQSSNGEDVSYTVEDPYEGEEVTLDLSESGESNDDHWIDDPNADDPYMSDTDGDGYKDTVFYSSSRTEYDVTNIEGKTVNIDTDGDGDVDKYDGVSATQEDWPVCEIDMNGGAWELVDYDPTNQTYRIKVVTPGDPEITSYLNIKGPCYIIPTNGTPPDTETLSGYSEDAMRHFKQSATDTLTVGDLLHGEQALDENATYFMDGTSLANIASLTTTEEQFDAGAVITIEAEEGKADDITIDCAGADVSFEWDGSDLHVFLTNAEGEIVEYVYKNFETAGMNGENANLADSLHLVNADISQDELKKLVETAPNYDGGDSMNTEDVDSGFYGDAVGYYNYSLANCIYTSTTDETGVETETSLFEQWQAEEF